MNTKNKKALYESIMSNVAKQVKKTLNESNYADDAETYAMDAIQRLSSENIDPSDALEIREDVLLVINNLCNILKPVLLYNFNTNSDEELAVDDFNQTVNRIRKML